MDEGRKRVILIAASILVAKKACELGVASPALNDAMDDAITLAERMMRKISAVVAILSQTVRSEDDLERGLSLEGREILKKVVPVLRLIAADTAATIPG